MPDAWITHLGYALPGPPVPQARFAEWMEPRLAPGTSIERWKKFNARCGVSFRHTVIDAFGGEGEAFWPLAARAPAGTAQRSRLFDQRALPLALAAVASAAAGDRDAMLAGVTHVVVVTCTGAVAPGLDIQLVRALGLPATVRRTVIAFMGCYAAVPALRLARDACRADAGAKVLVVCCELSSLHLQAGPSDDALLAACLFADGASVAVVRAAAAPVGLGLRIANDASALIEDSGDQMTWHAGDCGFVLSLSASITGSLSGDLAPMCARLLGEGRPAGSARWIVHPGGPRILDATERALDLDPTALASSRRALAEGGNRSSGTILAILADEIRQPWRGRLGMLAFGPGLTAEGMLLERHA